MWRPIFDTSQIKPGQIKSVTIDGRAIAIYNVEGEIYATGDTCSHEQVSLSEGYLDGCVVECDAHGAKFDIRTGEVKSLPATVGIKTYPVKIENGVIHINY
ncbi:non-heme iron oxygenase ferredoxin subunit [Candidatus Microgenomates bacterium]|nr:non-heme iron oxygenase ferredoxin subunit [Candidatus Microgenomates bacterium]